ncbi:hypothetical protein BP6252_10626 [Coleophoma cylindrospora]|uniref:Uncharacterized protein n=1 Tax=Coleophoma cylindrospora TaxID=1849047 RepID=A0A3D8QT64_9HELO|nr:hypothetical protein BP6252_10626 [Coleophoma cylindrospora]
MVRQHDGIAARDSPGRTDTTDTACSVEYPALGSGCATTWRFPSAGRFLREAAAPETIDPIRSGPKAKHRAHSAASKTQQEGIRATHPAGAGPARYSPPPKDAEAPESQKRHYSTNPTPR